MANGLFLLGCKTLQAQNPGDGPVDGHVSRPVGAEYHPLYTYSVDEEAKGSLTVGETVIAKLIQVVAGGLRMWEGASDRTCHHRSTRPAPKRVDPPP